MSATQACIRIFKTCLALLQNTYHKEDKMSITVLPRIALLLGTILLIKLVTVKAAWGDKVKLTDVKAITLYRQKMTTGRRTSPIPQLQCVGGTAGCHAFVPEEVQCYNRGSDGYDVQWECKTEMNNAYRFGRIEVVCEGYDYPNDPYVLQGSCGLEYTIDSTKQGSSFFKRYYSYGDYFNKFDKSSSLNHLLVLAVAALIIYALYKTCLERNQYSNTNSDYQNGDGRHNTGFFSNLFGRNRGSGYGEQPPPPGFRPEYYDSSGCSRSDNRRSTGFWQGAMTGGLLGYMFGRSNQGSSSRSSGYRDYSYDYGSRTTSFSDDHDSGTRTASGFGGTRRR